MYQINHAIDLIVMFDSAAEDGLDSIELLL